MAPKPLSLPLEVIEHILKLAFLPAVPFSAQDSTEPTPPRSTSHLLLVSKGIRQICLPFFWRSITISKPDDWISLFDPKEGIVVVGEEGRKRWELVEEVRIVVEAVVPVSMKPHSKWESYLAELNLPGFRVIPKVVFEHLPPSSDWNRPSWIAKEEERDAFRLRLFTLEEDFAKWSSSLDTATTPPDQSMERYAAFDPAEGQARRALDELEWDFWEYLSRDRRYFLHNLLASFEPRQAIIPSDYWSDSDLDGLISDEGSEPLYFPCHVEFANTPSSLQPGDLIFSANEVIRPLGGFTGSLVGLSSEFLAATEAWALDNGKMYAQSKKWDSVWSWKREDGSTFLIDFSKLILTRQRSRSSSFVFLHLYLLSPSSNLDRLLFQSSAPTIILGLPKTFPPSLLSLPCVALVVLRYPFRSVAMHQLHRFQTSLSQS
ncbi:hypothetical protein BDY24DRAFT_438440 [Mrakia frigida]|uniref:uncharacterized protein n=1 Tax=Mrakia frigida TaxID=29902 RepID=UPI003FCC1CF4